MAASSRRPSLVRPSVDGRPVLRSGSETLGPAPAAATPPSTTGWPSSSGLRATATSPKSGRSRIGWRRVRMRVRVRGRVCRMRISGVAQRWCRGWMRVRGGVRRTRIAVVAQRWRRGWRRVRGRTCRMRWKGCRLHGARATGRWIWRRQPGSFSRQSNNLIKNPGLDVTDTEGATPLAIHGSGSLAVVRLADHDANPNRADSYGSSRRIAAIRELSSSKGAYADPLWESGRPLYIAPQYGTVKMPNNVLHTQRKAPLLIDMESLMKNLVLHEDDGPQYETEGDATFCRRGFVGGVNRSSQNDEIKWVLDSGSSYHITGNKCWLKRRSEIDADKKLQFSVASGAMFCPTHEGDVRTNEIKLSGVYFIEGCSMNIISAGMLESQGLQIDFGDGRFTVQDPASSTLVGEGYLDTQGMRYVVKYLHFKKKYISEAVSPQEFAEASSVIAPEEAEQSTQSNPKKRKREATEVWIVDSGNAHHLTSSVDNMMKLHSVKKSKISLDTPFGQKIEVMSEGNKRSSTIRLNRVWFSPRISHNLISVPQLDTEGYRVTLFSGVCTIWWKAKPEPVGTALCDAGNHLYYVKDFKALSQEEQDKYA